MGSEDKGSGKKSSGRSMLSKAVNTASKSKSKADREHEDRGQQEGMPQSSASGGDGNEEKNDGARGFVKAARALSTAVSGAKAMVVVKTVTALVQKAATVIAGLNAVIQAVLAVVAAVVCAVVSLFFGMSAMNIAQRDSIVKDCVVYVDRAAIGESGVRYDAEAAVLRNKKRIYSVLFYNGLRPEQCFAILGNWTVESGLDPTAVETVFTEPFRLGTWKQAAVAYDFNPMFHGDSVYEEYFKDKPIERVGIGLGQWTNGRNEKLLAYAALAGKGSATAAENAPSYAAVSGAASMTSSAEASFEWYDLDLQLAYMLDTSSVGDSGAAFIKNFAAIGRVKSERQIRADADTIEFRGDLPVSTPYGDVQAIGDGTADEYYDGNLPHTETSCREDAQERANQLCAGRRNAGAYNIYEDGAYVGINEDAYKDDFSRAYRFCLYENMVKKYTYDFLVGWEGIDRMYEERLGYALDLFYSWYGCSDADGALGILIDPNSVNNAGFFKVEEGYGFSVLSVLEKTRDVNTAVQKIYTTKEDMTACRRIVRSEDDHSMARTAVTLAWPTKDASVGNKGTRIYQYIHDLVIPGDTVYDSCDRTVCTIVRWSGYDDEFPPGATLNLMAYLVGSPRWAELEWTGDPGQLQPGDVLIRKDSVAEGAEAEEEGDSHHVMMYVGGAAAGMYWKDGKNASEIATGPIPAANPEYPGHYVVHGSYEERSPGIDTWHASFSEYHAFRCIHRQPKGTSKYANYVYDMAADAGAG